MNYNIEDIIESAKGLTTKPEIIVKVEKMLTDPNISFKDVGKVINMSPGLAARVFKVANSCLFGRRSKAQNIAEAIVTIGIKGLYSLVIVHLIKEYYKKFGQEMSFWNHAVSVSITSVALASEKGLGMTEDAMVCGLLHDIGKDILYSAEPEAYGNIITKINDNGNGASYSDAEQDSFGFTHAEVGFELAKQWDFPEHIQTVILCHHNLAGVQKESLTSLRMTSLINLADTFCKKLEVDVNKPQNGFQWDNVEAATNLGFTEEQLTELEPVIRSRIAEEKKLFD